MTRTYSELSYLSSFLDRFNYLKLEGTVGKTTFGFDRYLNQAFYRSYEWKHTRNEVIVRDGGCDLGIEGFEINKKILIHHMNPISQKDIYERVDEILNPEYLISVSFKTHNAIHFGDEGMLALPTPDRKPNDTCPWK